MHVTEIVEQALQEMGVNEELIQDMKRHGSFKTLERFTESIMRIASSARSLDNSRNFRKEENL